MVINIKKGNYMKTKNLFKKKLKGAAKKLVRLNRRGSKVIKMAKP